MSAKLTNADILRLDRPAGAAADGAVIQTPGPDLAAGTVRGQVTNVKSGERMTIGAAIKDCTLKLEVRKASLADAGEDAPVMDMQVVLQLDGEDPQTGIVGWIEDFVKGGPRGSLTRWALFLRVI